MICRLKESKDVNKYYNDSFKTFLDTHQNQRFKIINDYGNCVRLKGVNFLVTKDCIISEEN